MTDPYRTDAAPPPCAHPRFVEVTLCGGEGPYDAASRLICPDCGATGWRFMARWYAPASIEWSNAR
jgi:hypothetical protein